MKSQQGIGKYITDRSRKAGLPPGSLVYIGKKQKTAKTRITVMEYDGNALLEQEINHISELTPIKAAPTITWINIDGVQNEALLAELGHAFQLNPLLLEDILNTDQRPKCEYLGNTIYIILKMFDFDADQQAVITEQVSLVVGPSFLLTFQEEVGDELDIIRERIRSNNQRVRHGGTGYLAYSILDAVVDRYFFVLEKIGQCLGELEDDIIKEDAPNILPKVHHLKRELIFLRKHTWPVRDVVGSLQHSDSPLLIPHMQYLRDVYDHTIQAMDTLETYRDLLTSIQDLYLSVLSNRMNEVMKVLTIISTLFIPLTFLVGVYGMNFQFMPELRLHWAYPTLWVIMTLIAVGMLSFFRRQKWI